MSLVASVALRNSILAQYVAAIDGGPGPGTIKFYTGAIPAAGGAITTQTLIGTCTFSDPSGTVAAGVLTFSAITGDAGADNAGTIAWGRVEDSTGAFVFDGDATLTAGTGVFRFNTLTATAGVPINVTSGSITEGNV